MIELHYLQELWQSLVNRSENKSFPESIMLAEYPKIKDFNIWKDHKAEGDMQVNQNHLIVLFL